MFGQVLEFEGPAPPAYLPTGFLIASAEDLTHFALAQLNAGQYGGTSILSPEGIAEMHAPAIPSEGGAYFALGWNAGRWEGMPIVWRLGDTGHFHADIFVIPERGSALVLLANASGFVQSNQADTVAIGVLNLMSGKPATPVSMPIGQRFLYWAVLLTPFLQILGILFVWRKRQRITGWGVLLTVIVNLAVVFLLLAFAQKIPFPLPSMLKFFPEVGYGLIAVVALGIGWSVVYTAMNLRARRLKRFSSS